VYSPVTGGSPARSAYAIPCRTNNADRTSPATIFPGQPFPPVGLDQRETRHVRPPPPRCDIDRGPIHQRSLMLGVPLVGSYGH
jgi:hypothetical protein